MVADGRDPDRLTVAGVEGPIAMDVIEWTMAVTPRNEAVTMTATGEGANTEIVAPLEGTVRVLPREPSGLTSTRICLMAVSKS